MTAVALPETLYDAAAEAAARWADRDFLVIGRRDEVLGFADLARKADLLARVLARKGVVPGTRVAMWMTNHIEWAVGAMAIARAGAVMVGVSTRLTPREAAHMMALSGAAMVIMEDSFLGKIDAVAIFEEVSGLLRQKGLPVPAVVRVARTGKPMAGALDWSEALGEAESLPPLPPAAELVGRISEQDAELEGVAAILSTSGTTGAPKGVMLTHPGLIRLAYHIGLRQELSPAEKFYSVGPFFHCSGFVHGLLTNLIAGSTYYSTNAYSADETWEVIAGEGITAYHGFVGALQDIADHHAHERHRLAAFDRAWYSAPAAKMAALEAALGVRQCEVYGLTEVSGNVAICTRDDPAGMRHDSDGRPHEGLEIRIVDPATERETEEGVPGEIRIRGWNVMKGYFRDPEATRRTLVDGWLKTGDLGVRLPGGYVKFVSRLKDIIRVGGENLSPAEVEEILIGHPGVLEAAVVAAPHPRLTEVPVAFLRLRPGAVLDAAALDAFCRKHLANFKVPHRFLAVEEFPRTKATNRIMKEQLRASLQEPTHA